MPKKRLIAVTLCLFLFSATAHAGTIFVNEKSVQPGQGTSWATAFSSLQQALSIAQKGDQIWVAEGVYRPTDSTDRNASFHLIPGVEVFGGFFGDETDLTQRKHTQHQTVLSGDIGQPGFPDDNVYHVVSGADGAVLDGFTVTGGYSQNTAWTGEKNRTAASVTARPQLGFGAGLLNFQASPIIRNCTFQDNHALLGGAVYSMTASTQRPTARPAQSPRFENCTFWQNSAVGHGGGVVNEMRTAPLFVSCVFDSNIADVSGGGMFNDFGTAPLILNSIFRNNEAKNGGGIANEGGSTPVLYYATFTGNRSSESGPAVFQGEGALNTTVLTKSIVWENECEGADTRFQNSEQSVIRVQDSVIQHGYAGKSVFRANPGLNRTSETMLNVGYKTNGHRFRASKIQYRIKDIERFDVVKNLPAYTEDYTSSVDPILLATVDKHPVVAPQASSKTATVPPVKTIPSTPQDHAMSQPKSRTPATASHQSIEKIKPAAIPEKQSVIELTPSPTTVTSPAQPTTETATQTPPSLHKAAESTEHSVQPKQQSSSSPVTPTIEPQKTALLTPSATGQSVTNQEASPTSKATTSAKQPNIDMLMLTMDTDGNGYITINEATGTIKDTFWRMDRNGDNTLSRTELVKATESTKRLSPAPAPKITPTTPPKTTTAALAPSTHQPSSRPKITSPAVPVISHAVATEAKQGGYTLFAPIGSKDTLLVDMNGTVVKTWHGKDLSTGAVYLLNNGNLLRSVSPGAGEIRTPFTGKGVTGGIIQEVSPRGQIVWEYSYISNKVRQHHDIAPLPNGNVLLLAWELKTESDIEAAGGSVRTHPDGVIWAEHIVEVRKSGPRSGTIVWEWHVWDHLVQNTDQSAPNYANPVRLPQRMDVNYNPTRTPHWLHANSIEYNPQLRQIVLCLCNTSEVWILDHSTTTEEAASNTGGLMHRGGDILFRWGNPQAYGAAGRPELVEQRDARWVLGDAPGKERILIFNNGNRQTQRSDILEIRPEYYFKSTRLNAQVVWSYSKKGGARFFADQASGAQRLPNGHTLISDSPAGRIVEVSSTAQPLWEYRYSVSGSSSHRPIYRASRIPPDHPGLHRLSITTP
ncbi:hypothetical protein GO013_13315 [Pseudodesulfovibrio sp. JC047]|uniref:aryl-sulfate sulfotransferase n=1 Tax=Pseudodesulfovibrio sp. JC047 TaxID=2683199 RepID=UPI0013D1FD3E|nr:aryl-sulfate sulfotransferase [Pseudodesulfovibrio sp. JC047]NDV20389.1 hypothetical protein [Pseudodesulfovibrio sp. JC047]